MERIDDAAAEALRNRIASGGVDKSTLRLAVALNYAAGIPVSDVCEMYGLPRRTVYGWLERFESGSIDEALRDDPRPGRPPRLTDDQRAALREAIAAPPRRVGVDAEEWTPPLLADYVEAAHGVDFSTRHVRRWLDDPSLLESTG